MNIKLTARFRFGYSAALACILVAFANLAPSLLPIGAVIGVIAAFPVDTIWSRYIIAIFSLVSNMACLATKTTARYAGGPDIELLSALRARQEFSIEWARLCFFAVHWVVFTAIMLRQPIAETFARAESAPTISRIFYDSAALIAFYGFSYGIKVFAKIVFCLLHSAFTRAIRPRPAFVIPKFFAANRAIRCDSTGVFLALPRAVSLLFLAPVVPKFLATSRAG